MEKFKKIQVKITDQATINENSIKEEEISLSDSFG
jgi:hypothetical protein